MLQLLNKPSQLDRSDSLTTTDMSSFTTESELDTSLLVGGNQYLGTKNSKQLDPCSSSCGTERSVSLIDLTEEEIDVLSKKFQKEQRSILVVRTQKESLTLSQLSSSQRKQPAPPSVSFGKLHIREFARRPGDNPGCRIGVSLTIDWEVQDEMSLDVEDYEASRAPRRDRGELNIPSDTRMQMLRDSGYSRGEILTYVKMANIARGQRNRTNETLQLAGAQEIAQRLYRGVFNKTLHRSKKKAEKKLQKDWRAKDQQFSVLRRQLTAEAATAENNKKNKKAEQRRASAPAMPTPEQAPTVVTPRRKVKRDSLAIIAPVAVPATAVADDISESSGASDNVGNAVDVDVVVSPSSSNEVEC